MIPKSITPDSQVQKCLATLILLIPMLFQSCGYSNLDLYAQNPSLGKRSDEPSNTLVASEETIDQEVLNLIEDMDHKDHNVRRAAINAFRRMVEVAPEKVETVLPLLSKAAYGKDNNVRNKVLLLLKKAVHDKDHNVRSAAINDLRG